MDPGATDGCTVVFRRSNPATPVQVETHWDVEWSANGVPQGALDPMTTSGDADVPVQESQSVVTGIG